MGEGMSWGKGHLMTDRKLDQNVPFKTGLVRSKANFPCMSLHKEINSSRGQRPV